MSDDTNVVLAANGAGEQVASGKNPSKASYSSPKLTILGSVKTLTGSGTGVGTDMTTMKPMTSDRSMKENIVKVGDHPSGFGLYLFDYKPQYHDSLSAGRQFGVMADEIETVVPEAVVIHADGYKMVNYAMLGIQQATS
jgi:hypothetical protein